MVYVGYRGNLNMIYGWVRVIKLDNYITADHLYILMITLYGGTMTTNFICRRLHDCPDEASIFLLKSDCKLAALHGNPQKGMLQQMWSECDRREIASEYSEAATHETSSFKGVYIRYGPFKNY